MLLSLLVLPASLALLQAAPTFLEVRETGEEMVRMLSSSENHSFSSLLLDLILHTVNDLLTSGEIVNL